MIVSEQDPDLTGSADSVYGSVHGSATRAVAVSNAAGCHAAACHAATSTLTAVPAPGALRTAKVPPTSPTLVRIPRTP